MWSDIPYLWNMTVVGFYILVEILLHTLDITKLLRPNYLLRTEATILMA